MVVVAAAVVAAVVVVVAVATVVAAAADSGRITQTRSPETMPQDDRVCPVSDRSSEPFRDKLKSVSALSLREGRTVSLM